ncbi:MAG: Crp/Fnr family transcriptional regulator [Archangium sp.]|nr:Crp/Fnr family transcriptional regulator [Archangium sp.]
MTKTAHDYRELLAAGKWFSGLPAAFREALVQAAVLRVVQPEERLFSRGDAPDGLYAVIDGAIRATGVGSDGKEAVLALVEPPQWFGEIAVFDGLARTHDAIAVVESKIVHVPSAALSAMLEANPRWWKELALLVTTKLRLAFVMMEDTALLPLAPRVARRLVLMAEGYGEWADRSKRVVSVRQEVLGAMVSASRQSINQVLKDLEARGLIKIAYGEIEILDLEALKRG